MSGFQVAVLASGSKGNATVMRCESGMVLVDAGISCRRIAQGMQKLGLRPEIWTRYSSLMNTSIM